MYCVPMFNGIMLHKNFGRRLLPITSKEPQGIEGMAGKYVIKVYGPHNKLIQTGQEGVRYLSRVVFGPLILRTDEQSQYQHFHSKKVSDEGR